MSSYSRITLENWLKTIDVKGSVLDVGGSQNPIKKRTKSWDVERYEILDLPDPHEGGQVDIECDIQSEGEEIDYDCWGMPINEPGASEKSSSAIIPIYKIRTNREKFDTAFCIEVSEYWYNPLQALKNINVFLKKGGILYISFHFIYEIHPPVEFDYLRYTPGGVAKLLEESGLVIEDMVIREFGNPENAKRLYDEEGMRGDKSLYNIQGCLVKAKKI